METLSAAPGDESPTTIRHTVKLDFSARVFGAGLSSVCHYELWKDGDITGGTNPTIVYQEAIMILLSGSNSLCPARTYLSGTFNITTPTPLYVEQY